MCELFKKLNISSKDRARRVGWGSGGLGLPKFLDFLRSEGPLNTGELKPGLSPTPRDGGGG